MAIRVAINHKTEYRFDRPVMASPHVVRLRPAPHTRTPVESYSLKVLPKEHFINWQQDPFGNYLARLVFPEPVTEMSFEVDLVAEIVTINPFDFFVEKYADALPFRIYRRFAQGTGSLPGNHRGRAALAKMAGGRRPVAAGDQ